MSSVPRKSLVWDKSFKDYFRSTSHSVEGYHIKSTQFSRNRRQWSIFCQLSVRFSYRVELNSNFWSVWQQCYGLASPSLIFVRSNTRTSRLRPIIIPHPYKPVRPSSPLPLCSGCDNLLKRPFDSHYLSNCSVPARLVEAIDSNVLYYGWSSCVECSSQSKTAGEKTHKKSYTNKSFTKKANMNFPRQVQTKCILKICRKIF